MMNAALSTVVLACYVISVTYALDNGLARTPPMGWLTWERFRCNTDCVNDPDNCISENLIKRTADRMVADGYLDAGYEYITIDDCWLAKSRDAEGRLQPDPERFPSGMKALADYVHSKGLKFGIYEDFGTNTCAGFPGSEFYMQTDAQTFAHWGVDMLKFDGCNSDPSQSDVGYPTMGFYLNQTGRPILYSCEWPLYQLGRGTKPNYKAVAHTCNIARNNFDIDDTWDSVIGVIEVYANDKYSFSQVAGPGFWNDPDMLVIGNFGLSHDEERVQMAMWAMMAAPLFMSTDLGNIRPSSRSILLNKNVIAINQDPLGKQGRRIANENDVQVWTRPLSQQGATAVAILYNQAGNPLRYQTSLRKLGLTNQEGYNVTELFGDAHVGLFRPDDAFSCFVNPSGVYLFKATPLHTL